MMRFTPVRSQAGVATRRTLSALASARSWAKGWNKMRDCRGSQEAGFPDFHLFIAHEGAKTC